MAFSSSMATSSTQLIGKVSLAWKDSVHSLTPSSMPSSWSRPVCWTLRQCCISNCLDWTWPITWLSASRNTYTDRQLAVTPGMTRWLNALRNTCTHRLITSSTFVTRYSLDKEKKKSKSIYIAQIILHIVSKRSDMDHIVLPGRKPTGK